MNLILLGAPGTGKGTIASRLAKEMGFTHIAPGDMLRDEVRKGGVLGKKIKSILDAGTLVSDDIVNELIKGRVDRDNVFDGYPRTPVQAQALDKLVNVDVVVLFDMDEKEIVERLKDRRVCPLCKAVYHLKNIVPKVAGICDSCGAALIVREDDKPDTIKKRFSVYMEQTAPVIGYYKKKRILKTLDASMTPDEVIIKVKRIVGL